MLPAATIELLMHQDPPIGIPRQVHPIRHQHPGCRAIHQRQLRDAEGIHLWRQPRHCSAGGTQLGGPEGRKPGNKKEQHQRQWQRCRQELQAAPQNTTQAEGASQLMAQQTGKGSNASN